MKPSLPDGVRLCIKAIDPSSSVGILDIVPGVMGYTLGLRPRVAPHHTRYNIQYADLAVKIYCLIIRDGTSTLLCIGADTSLNRRNHLTIKTREIVLIEII